MKNIVYQIALSEKARSHAFESGIAEVIGNVYEDRETAQVDADAYNAEFNDAVPAAVVEANFVPTVKA